MKNKKSMKYVIIGEKRYIGFHQEMKKNIPVHNYEKAVKFRYTKALSILENLDEEVKKLESWKIISVMEVEEDFTRIEVLDLDQMITSLEVDFTLLIKRKKVLELEYLEIEREITDIYHAMEFYNLNVIKGFKLYKMMQERLIRRRKNKDEVLKIKYILSGGMKGLTNNQTREKIERLNHRHYQPRVLKELFEF